MLKTKEQKRNKLPKKSTVKKFMRFSGKLSSKNVNTVTAQTGKRKTNRTRAEIAKENRKFLSGIVTKLEPIQPEKAVSEIVEIGTHSLKKAQKDDARRSEVVRKKGKQKLADFISSAGHDGSLACRQFHRILKLQIIPKVLQVISECNEDVFEFTLSAPSISMKKFRSENPDTFIRDIKKALAKNLSNNPNGLMFAFREEAIIKTKVKPHFHILASGDYRSALIKLKKKNTNQFSIYKKKKAIESQEHYANIMNYMLKGVTYNKGSNRNESTGKKYPPKPKIEVAYLVERSLRKLEDYILLLGINTRISQPDIKSRLKMGNRKKLNLSLPNKVDAQRDSIAKKEQKWEDAARILASEGLRSLSEDSCHIISQLITKPEKTPDINHDEIEWLVKGQTNKNNIALFIQCKSKCILAVLKPKNPAESLRIQLASAGIPIAANRLIIRILEIADNLKNEFAIAELDHLGLNFLDSGEQTQTAVIYAVSPGKYIGDLQGIAAVPPLAATSNEMQCVSTKGSFSTYQGAISDFVKDNPVACCVLGFSLLSIIQRIPNLNHWDQQGTMLNLNGKTGVGKTICTTMFALSTWRDINALLTWDNTDNFMKDALARHDGGLVVLDDLTHVSPDTKFQKESVTKIAMSLSAGQQRKRLGDAEPGSGNEFKTNIISSSNVNISRIPSKNANIADAITRRCPELLVDGNFLEQLDVSRTHNTLLQNHGFLGPLLAMYVCQQLQNNTNKFAIKINKHIEQFESQARAAQDNDLTELQKMHCSKLGAIYACLKIAQNAGILPLDKWGNFDLPILAAFQSVCNSTEITNRDESISGPDVGPELIKCAKALGFNIVDSTSPDKPLVKNIKAKKSIFLVRDRKTGNDAVAVASRDTLIKLVPGISEEDLLNYQQQGYLLKSKKSGTYKKQIRIRRRKKKETPVQEWAYVFVLAKK